MKSLKAAAIAATLVGTASMSQAATIDFGSFSEGTVLGANTNLGGGIFADVSSLGGVNQAVIFDTAPGTTSTRNDPDLTADFTNSEDSSDVRDFGNVCLLYTSPSPRDRG